MHLIAAGIAVTVTLAALSRITEASTGVRFLPIEDIPGSALVVAWRPYCSAHVLVQQFVAAARDVRDREHDLVHSIEHPVLPRPAPID